MHANGDAAFAFEVHGVQVLGLELARGDGAGLEQELVGQRALTVIDMRDDREVPYVAGHVWLVTLAGPHARKLTIPGAAASGTLRKYTDFAAELGARSVSEKAPAAATNTQSSTDFTDFTDWNSSFESVKPVKSVDDPREDTSLTRRAAKFPFPQARRAFTMKSANFFTLPSSLPHAEYCRVAAARPRSPRGAGSVRGRAARVAGGARSTADARPPIATVDPAARRSRLQRHDRSAAPASRAARGSLR